MGRQRWCWGSGVRESGSGAVMLLAWVIGLAAMAAMVADFAVVGEARAAEVAPASISVGAYPQGVDFSTDGTFALVANSGSDNVSRIRTSDNVVVATIPVGDGPSSVAIAPDDSFALVTNYWGASVSRIRTSDNTVTATITGFSVPADVAIAPDGTFAYVTNAGTDSVARIRLSDNVVTGTTAVGDAPIGVAFAPDGSFAYVANSQSSTVSRLRTSDNTAVATTSVGAAGTQPLFLAMSPDGTFAYVNTGGNSAVARIRTSDNALVTSIPVPGGAQEVAISRDGTFAYVTLSTAGNLSRIRTSDNSVTTTFGVGSGPHGVAIAPSGIFAYVTRQGSGLVARVEAPGAPTNLIATPGNGQASVTFTPPPSDVAITNYQYSINDGATWVTRSPASPATPLVITGLVNGTTYNVRLRAINPLGTGPASAAVAVQPKTVPGVPTVTSVTPGPGSVTVVFEPPAETGGVPLTNYQWTVNDGVTWNNRTPASTASPLVVTGLTNSIHAKVKLRAVNAAGAGPATATVTVTVGSIPVGSRPGSVAIAPNGTFAYVTNRMDNTVSRVRTADDQQVATIGVGAAPGSVTYAPDGSLAFVTNKNENTVSAIRTATDTLVGTYAVGNTPVAAAFAINGASAYVVNQGAGTVTKLSAAGAALKTIKVGTWPTDVKVAPGGAYAYVSNGWERTVSKIDTTTDTVVATIAIGTPQIVGNPYAGGPTRIAFAPDGSFAYITNDDDATLARITTATNTVTKLGVGGTPRGVAIRPDGLEAYVTNEAADTVLRVRTSDTTVQSTILVGMAPSSVAFAPDGSFAYITNSGERSLSRIGLPGAPTGLVATPGNASASITFAPPVSDGGASLTNYKYATSANAGGTWSAWTALSPADLTPPVTIPGLVNGTGYLVKLRAVTASGDGTPSDSVAVTPRTVPSAPTGLVATPGDTTASIAFTAPSSNGGAAITTYKYSTDGGATWVTRSPASPASPLLITGLSNGTTYQVQLRAVNAGGDGATSAAVPVTPVAPGPPGMVFVPVDPARVADTRTQFGGAGPIVTETSRVLSVAATQAGGVPVVPAGATAIVFNLTVPNPTAAGHLRVMPGDAATLTSASAINFRLGETIANGLTLKIDAQRRIAVYAAVTADVVVDVVGYFVPAVTPPAAPTAAGPAGSGPLVPASPAGSRFTALTPVRVYDAVSNPAGPLAGNSSRLVSTATAQDGTTPVVPTGATAVAYNITVVRPQEAGHLRVMPGDVATSAASTINWTVPGDVIANGLTVRVDAQRQVRVFNNTSKPVTFLLDVVGYYSGTGTLFYPTDPARVLDTRTAFGGAGPIATGASGQRTASVANAQAGGAEQVPVGATAIAYNLTVTGTTSNGHLRVWPARTPLVDASTINWPGAGYSRANGTIVAISGGREVTVYNGSGTPTDALIDTLGYYK